MSETTKSGDEERPSRVVIYKMSSLFFSVLHYFTSVVHVDRTPARPISILWTRKNLVVWGPRLHRDKMCGGTHARRSASPRSACARSFSRTRSLLSRSISEFSRTDPTLQLASSSSTLRRLPSRNTPTTFPNIDLGDARADGLGGDRLFDRGAPPRDSPSPRGSRSPSGSRSRGRFQTPPRPSSRSSSTRRPRAAASPPGARTRRRRAARPRTARGAVAGTRSSPGPPRVNRRSRWIARRPGRRTRRSHSPPHPPRAPGSARRPGPRSPSASGSRARPRSAAAPPRERFPRGSPSGSASGSGSSGSYSAACWEVFRRRVCSSGMTRSSTSRAARPPPPRRTPRPPSRFRLGSSGGSRPSRCSRPCCAPTSRSLDSTGRTRSSVSAFGVFP